MRLGRRIHSTEDAKRLAQSSLPRLVFDFIEGGAGREVGLGRNQTYFDSVLLQPRVMADVKKRSLGTQFLGSNFDMPLGIAPMGMCNLVCPHADRFIAELARSRNIPMSLSSAGSSTLEDIRRWAGENAWFQLYFGQSREATLTAVDRARNAGYSTLILTADVPQVSRRVRDLRNGFTVPFRMTPRTFIDFALHPVWSLSTLAAGVPSPKNFSASIQGETFIRTASRAGADWEFLKHLRDHWAGNLIVKGIVSPTDALQAKLTGVDAIYVSNHGARQLDCAPPSAQVLPAIRQTVGADFPIIFDSGIRNGEDVAKALILGADFVMLGRPVLFALGASGRTGLNDLFQCFAEDIDVSMAQLGVRSIPELGAHNLYDGNHEIKGTATRNAKASLLVAGQP